MNNQGKTLTQVKTERSPSGPCLTALQSADAAALLYPAREV